jgi:hypothetical protein
MRIVANTIPKSGPHLLDRLLMLLGFRMVEGGIRPHLVSDRCRCGARLLTSRWPEAQAVAAFGETSTRESGAAGGSIL